MAASLALGGCASLTSLWGVPGQKYGRSEYRFTAEGVEVTGVITEVSLKVLPRPTDEATLVFELNQSDALAQLHRKACLGFSDCLILEVARKAGHVPLGIFDRQLARLDGAEKL